MLLAVAKDFSRLDQVTVKTLVETPLPSLAGSPTKVESAAARDKAFDQLAASCDATLLIAPEFEGILLRLASRVSELGGRLLSPGPEFIAIASDKHETAIRLHAKGVNVPEGIVLMPGERSPDSFRYPAILKPIDGAGSIGVERWDQPGSTPTAAGAYRLEHFVEGTPVSVAVVCGPNKCVPLAPSSQRLDNQFAYEGGSLPLADDLQKRATSLALEAVEALPERVGYVGVDMVLGESKEGSGDKVIEINPRYTTSYVGLRAATRHNLAKLVLDLSNGEPVSQPEWERAVEFDATGEIRER